jgi:uncharacterized protein involved in outer membrane biogenesis
MVDTATDSPPFPPPPAPARTLRSRLGRWLAWALGGLLLLWGLAWLGVPPLLKWQLEKQGSERLGRAVTVEQVRLRPWTLELWVDGLRVADAAGGGALLSVRQLYIDAELQSLLRLAPVIDALRIDTPQFALRHLGEGRWDFDDVLARLTPAEAAAEPDEGPARFAIFNIELVDGQASVVDEPVGVTHRLDALQLTVPFLSSLGSRREVVTEPRLAFTLNGSAFDSQAATTPFAEDRQTRARVQIPTLDLAPYLPYWPKAWPVRLAAGALHLDLTLDFEQHAEPTLVVSGSAGVSNLRLDETDGPPLLLSSRLDVALQRVEPLRRRVALGAVRWQGPEVDLRRDAQGLINVQRLAAGWQAASTRPAESAPPAPSSPQTAWQVGVQGFELSGAVVRWRDESVKPRAEQDLRIDSLTVAPIAWPVTDPARIQIAAAVGEATLKAEGEFAGERAQLRAALDAWGLRLAGPYLAAVLEPELDGRARAALVLDWARGAPGEADRLSLQATELVVDQLHLGPAKRPLARLDSLRLADVNVDLAQRRAELGQVVLDNPQLDVHRDARGQWMAQRWVKAPAADATPDPAAAPWAWRVADLRLQGGRVRFLDEAGVRPVRLNLDRFDVRLQDLQAPGAHAPEMPLSLKLRVADGETPVTGTVSADGRLRLPGAEGVGPDLRWRSRVRVERFPVHALEPYLADRLNLELLRADTSVRGDIDLSLPASGPRVEAAVDVAVEDFRANTLAPGEELLQWESLQVRGLRVRSAPNQALSVNVAETVLSDYYARIAIDENGRFNLQDLIKPAPGEAAEASAAPAAAPTTASAAAPATTAAAVTPPSGPAPDIRVGPISLVNGRVLFSDRFVRPNYSANLSEVTGSLSAFSSAPAAPGQAPEMATLSLKGRAEGTATLDVNGQLNPLAKPLALDIKGAVRDLELPPLSPYSVKYAGYGIERGKLSVDVAYRVEPNGQLTASNQIVLNQLAFGERVPDSPANLPVKLAVALLADRSGVIDINLPISGSLNDPQFRLGPVIVRVIVNLIGKAITAPFSLIASAFSGGGADASQVDFAPGRVELADAQRAKLETLAKALENRPALRVTIVGHSDLEAERAGWQRARLDALLQAEKRRRLARAGGEVPAQVSVSAQERPELLREVYRRADIPKPRNVVGLVKDIPLEEMESLLLAAQAPTADTMRELAVARAMAVKDFLASQRLPEDRLFLGAPKTAASGGQWQPQAQLQLAPR